MTGAPAWSETAILRLTASTLCPACESGSISDARCTACGADFTRDGGELWEASIVAANALRHRQAVLDRVPRIPLSAPVVARSEVGPPAVPAVHARPAAPVDEASATVQSVLAVAGAGLVGIAALVFTFFNPDFTNRSVRTLVIGAIALVFLGGTAMLARRLLAFSAEAVGGLGLVFLALGVGSAIDGAAAGAMWAGAATGALVLGAAMLGLGTRIRIRVWVWTSVIALAAVPALYGAALGGRLAVTAGALGSAFAAFPLIGALPRVADRFSRALTAEAASLTVAQMFAVVIALAAVVMAPSGGPAAFWLGTAAALAIVAVLALLSAGHPAGPLWCAGAGIAGVTAFALLPLSASPLLGEWLLGEWLLAAVPAAATSGAIVVIGLLPVPRRVHRGALAGGSLAVVGAIALAPVTGGALVGAATVFGIPAEGDDLLSVTSVAVTAVALGAVASGLVALGAVARGHGDALRWLPWTGAWFGAAAVLVALTSPGVLLGARVALALALAVAAALVLARVPSARRAPLPARLPVIVGAHSAVVLGGVLSLRDDAIVVTAGIGVVVAILALSRTLAPRVRFVHVGVAYAYALFIVGVALTQLGLGSLPVLCLVTCAGGVFAIAATFADGVRARSWWAILTVTAVPFAVGVVQVVFERSGWTALSTAVIFLLALALTTTRRPGLGRPLRALASGLLMPTLAVVAVCLGAQFLVTSGSPVVLPVVAALVAATLPSLPLVESALASRVGPAHAVVSTRALELSTLVTGTITVALALAREAAGLGTTLVVLLVLAVGGAGAALRAGRRYGWWMSGAALTGALWCTWGIAGVGIAEPYLLPPALAAALVGGVVVARGGRAHALYATGLALAVLPVLALLLVVGSPDGSASRAYGLVTAAMALVAAGTALRARGGVVRTLGFAPLALALVAGAAGAVQAVRWGIGSDSPPQTALPLVLVCIGIGVAGALPAAVAARFLQADLASPLARTWLALPAVLFVSCSAWTAIDGEWFTIWTMWTLMVALLAAMLVFALRGATRSTDLPPAAAMFAIAFVTAVIAWSPRELRVEWFSLPLGILLLATGATALRGHVTERPRTLSEWPGGWRGSWATLGPGIVVTLSASVAATYTDPLTARAILVIVLALAAIIVGAAGRLAAPFLLGIVVLPIENVLAFVVQIGRGIESMPWWITLSVVGAVLLMIAVTYERRSGGDAGIAARLRDLR